MMNSIGLVMRSSAYLLSGFVLLGCGSSSSSSEGESNSEPEQSPIVMTAGPDHFINLATTNRIILDGNAVSTAGEAIDSFSWSSSDSLTITNADERTAYVIIDDSFPATSTDFELLVTDSLGNTETKTITYSVLNAGSSVDCSDSYESRVNSTRFDLLVNSLGHDRDLVELDDINISEDGRLNFSFASDCLSPIPLKSVTASFSSLNASVTEWTSEEDSLSIEFGLVDDEESATIKVRYEFVDGSGLNERFSVNINDVF